MARDEFCDVESYADEWSSKVHSHVQWHGRPRRDTLVSIIEEMWQRPLADCAVAVEPDSLAERFREQAEKWENETGHLSSPTQKLVHPSYQAILGMGSEHKIEVLSLLLRDLEKNRRPWFWALSYLSQDNPIRPADAGKKDRMIAAWLTWGKAKGLL
ncbi:MAG TPA: hypothetical protein VFE61_15865 [Candidatus Sulfotelmatobacter sp.]|jgi:hypothetical protein|nr:hypothetical protein [Candidatus Sulfotelmatobacter sp.]